MKRSGLRRRARIRKVRARKPVITDRMLDQACRAVVFARDGYRCLYDGSTQHLQWAHVYSRRYKSIRWDPDNSMCLSAGAHLLWHHQPARMIQWWIGLVGEEKDDQLWQKLRRGDKIDREATLEHLQTLLKTMEPRQS